MGIFQSETVAQVNIHDYAILAETVFENGSIFSAEKNPDLARVLAPVCYGILEFLL